MAWSGKFKNGETFSDLTDDELNRFESEIDPTSVQEITQSQEQKSALANQMREQAKSQFAQDMEAQKQAELDSRFDTPLGKFVKNVFPRSAGKDMSGETVIQAAQDVTSLPGRFLAEGIGSLSEALGTAYSNKGNPQYIDKEIADIGSRFMDNVGNIENGNLARDITTDPLLLPLAGVNTITIPGRAMLTGLAKIGTGTGAIVANEYGKPGEMSIEENAAPIITGTVLNALPELKLLKGVVDKARARHDLIGGAETLLKGKGDKTFLLSNDATNPTKIPLDQLKQYQEQSKILNNLTETGKNAVPLYAGWATDITGVGNGLGTLAGIGASTLVKKVPAQIAAQKGMSLLSGLLEQASRIPRTSAPVVDNTRVRYLK